MSMKKLPLFVVCSLLFLVDISLAQINRPYEPIVIHGDNLFSVTDTTTSFLNHEIAYLFLYSYKADMDSWEMIPFQIDEVNADVDDSVKYFIPEPDSLLNIFDSDDELVFIGADLGDKADSTRWIEDTSAVRLEIKMIDLMDNEKGYLYLYYSTEISDPIPNTYEMAFDSLNDRVSSAYYELGFLEREGDDQNLTGQLNDVIIKSGTGEDIFDRLKIRAIGSWWIIPIYLFEDLVKASYAYVKQGPVRIIRNMVGHFIYEPLSVDEVFTQTSFFYPWNGSFKLIDLPLKDAKDIGADVDIVRVSWDFNQNADGMKFYSEYNQDENWIDGVMQEIIDPGCNPDELNWTMGAGDQGSLLNVFLIPELGDNIGLYYHEALDGSVGDDSNLSSDSGDNFSFADNGFSLDGNIENYITDETTFSVIYYNYFLPPNLRPEDASLICEQIKVPLAFVTEFQKYTPAPTNVAHGGIFSPSEFILAQNYPNPFNAITTISFSLPKRTHALLRIYDSLGRLIYTVVEQDLSAGLHKFVWSGQNADGASVPSGMYFYKLTAGNFNSTKKLVLIK